MLLWHKRVAGYGRKMPWGAKAHKIGSVGGGAELKTGRMPVALLFETLLQNFSNELQYIRLLKSRNLSSTPPSLPDSPLYSGRKVHHWLGSGLGR